MARDPILFPASGGSYRVSRLLDSYTVTNSAGDTFALHRPFTPPPSFGDSITLNMNLLVSSAPASFTDNVTFSRASSAHRWNSSGYLESVTSGTARFDYVPGTSTPRGLLLETQRTNLFTYSNTFTNAVWNKVSCTATAASSTGPDNTTSMTEVKAGSAGGTDISYIAQQVTVATSTAHTYSIFAKAGTKNFIALRTLNFTTPGTAESYFNLSTGAVTATGTGHTAAIESVGGGIYRCSITFTTDVADTSGVLLCYICNASGSLLTDQNGTSSVYVFGAQCEAGSDASSYIATTASTVTRLADSGTISGSAFTALGIADGGTVVCAFEPRSLGGTALTVSDGTANEAITISASAASHLKVVDGGATQADIDGGTITALAANKVAIGFAANDFGVSIGGAAAVTDTSGTMPTVDRLILGTMPGWIRSVEVFSTKADSATLATESA